MYLDNVMLNSECFDWNDHAYIKSRVQAQPQHDEEKILAYLKSGNRTAACASIIRDCFKPEVYIETCGYTDTIWQWHDALIYYVEHYHFKISEDFLSHMKSHDWKVPQLSEKEILELSERHFEIMKREQTINVLECATEHINKGLILKVYNLKFLMCCVYDSCAIGNIKVMPNKDRILNEFCLGYDDINDHLHIARIYEKIVNNQSIKYAADITGNNNYVYWEILE